LLDLVLGHPSTQAATLQRLAKRGSRNGSIFHFASEVTKALERSVPGMLVVQVQEVDHASNFNIVVCVGLRRKKKMNRA